MNKFSVHLFLSSELTEAFPRSKLKYWVHELVRLAPMEAPDSLNQLQALILAQEDCFAIFVFIFINNSVCRLHAAEEVI